MKESKLFSQMPLSSVFALENWQEKFQEKVQGIYNDADEVHSKNIANMICEKLISNDPDDCWSIDDYKEFRRIFAKIQPANIEILECCIEPCLMMPNSEIFRELKSFGAQVEWYPFSEKIKDKNTNQYYRKEKEIKLTDCFLVANSLAGYVYQFIGRQAVNYMQLFGEIEDITIVLNLLKEDTSMMELLFTAFDSEFHFVAENSLFNRIYFTVRDELVERVIQEIYYLYSKEKCQKAHQQQRHLGIGASTYAIRQGYWQRSSEEKYYGKDCVVRRLSPKK